MSSHNEIVLSADPKGHFIEGIIEGTPKPGTCMMIKAATEPDSGGRLTYVVWNGAADGEQDEVIVLLPDSLQGKTPSDAYVTGTRGYLYIPVAGDELQVLAADAGTQNTFAIGDKLMIDDGTGLAIATTGSPEMEPFKVMETVDTDIEANTLIHVRYTGH